MRTENVIAQDSSMTKFKVKATSPEYKFNEQESKQVAAPTDDASEPPTCSTSQHDSSESKQEIRSLLAAVPKPRSMLEEMAKKPVFFPPQPRPPTPQESLPAPAAGGFNGPTRFPVIPLRPNAPKKPLIYEMPIVTEMVRERRQQEEDEERRRYYEEENNKQRTFGKGGSNLTPPDPFDRKEAAYFSFGRPENSNEDDRDENAQIGFGENVIIDEIALAERLKEGSPTREEILESKEAFTTMPVPDALNKKESNDQGGTVSSPTTSASSSSWFSSSPSSWNSSRTLTKSTSQSSGGTSSYDDDEEDFDVYDDYETDQPQKTTQVLLLHEIKKKRMEELATIVEDSDSEAESLHSSPRASNSQSVDLQKEEDVMEIENNDVKAKTDEGPKADEELKADEEPKKEEDVFVPRRSKRQKFQTDFYGYGKKK
ncbi:Oidioi.mRNA.OKI2018_I69.XSR.g17019.t1.cds [Oikopleura dioica]|uniref:Oidioi.mRNA.OKI2018_I69.XSR.g17019.t1.cds n=1 Tax=Oikopleura dioica TaxID=34765 RepID=A0ABN7SN18_OIKDI|nr:Oidioi.mRNA.OKI2018_I69.XSR.g17019.t1.cds [Oikopleura dioica]